MSRALILIDFIHEFLHPDGKITSQGMGKFIEQYGTLENVRKLITYFRENKEEIIWIHLGFHHDYSNCSRISPRFRTAPEAGILKEGTWSTEFLEELGYDPSEKTIMKTRVSPFYQTELESYLKEKNIKEIVVGGVATDLAVSSIARDAHDRDIMTTVISDACATVSLEHHEAALVSIGKLANTQKTEDFIHQ